MAGSFAERRSPISAQESIFRLARELKHGRLQIRFGEGEWRKIGAAGHGIEASMRINNPAALIRRYVAAGAVGFAESYIAGEWDSPDLARLLELFDSNQDAWSESYGGGWLSRRLGRLYHWRHANNRTGSQRNIHAHYDLGNAFFERWLDPGMTYSGAIFERDDEPLDAAQQRKYRALAHALEITPDNRVLEIGCGWGGFAELAAKEFGARLICVTISREQHAYACARMQREGLNDKVDVRLQDYRDIEGHFDRIASIEMFEAVGERYWPVFFERLRASLAPAGQAGLQIITIADRHFEHYRRNADFIQRYIFPGGMLPSPAALDEQFDRAGLAKIGERSFGLDYARTLDRWNRRFEQAWESIKELGFDERFRRVWLYYLAYCEAGFRTGSTDVRQILLKPG